MANRKYISYRSGKHILCKNKLIGRQKTLFLIASIDKSGVIGATVKWIRLSNEEAHKYSDMKINQLRTIDGKGI